MGDDRRRAPSLLQMVQQNDEKHEGAHTRLRLAMDRLESRLEEYETSCAKMDARVSVVEKARPEVEDLKWSTSRVAWIVGIALSIAGGMYASTYGLRSDVRDILTRTDAAIKQQDERSNTLKTAIEAQAKLQDERSNNLKSSIDEMKRRIELQQFEISGLKDLIGQQGGGKK